MDTSKGTTKDVRISDASLKKLLSSPEEYYTQLVYGTLEKVDGQLTSYPKSAHNNAVFDPLEPLLLEDTDQTTGSVLVTTFVEEPYKTGWIDRQSLSVQGTIDIKELNNSSVSVKTVDGGIINLYNGTHVALLDYDVEKSQFLIGFISEIKEIQKGYVGKDKLSLRKV